MNIKLNDIDKTGSLITNRRISKSGASKGCVSIAILGHVDSGKSTTCGQLLVASGRITEQNIKANEKVGTSMGKSSFKYAFVMDNSPEERLKGVTINTNTKEFETESKIVTIIDCPGHEQYGKNAIHGMSQADMGMIVLSAPDFATKNLSLDEMEAKACNAINHLKQLRNFLVQMVIIAVNKIDAIEYSEERYENIIENYSKVLKANNFSNSESDIKDKGAIPYKFIPISAFIEGGLSINISTSAVNKMPWYTGMNLIDEIDAVPLREFDPSAPAVAKMTKLTHPKGMGSIITATVLSGEFRPGMKVIIKPAFIETEIKTIQCNYTNVEVARIGDAIGLAIKGTIKKDELAKDSLISEIKRAPKMVKDITVKIKVEPSKSLSWKQNIQLYISTTRVAAEVTEILGLYKVDMVARQLVLTDKTETPISEGKKERPYVPEKKFALVKLTPERPIVVSKEGQNCITKLSRVIINDGMSTIAFGTIVDFTIAITETE